MLSLSRVNSAQATSYYCEDNYYTKDAGIENSNWWGRGAKELGLEGKISAEIFENLLAGKSVDGTEQLVNKSTKASGHKERAGLDMTFSASKSVTLCSLEDSRLVDAHKKAVNEALRVIEKNYSFARTGKEREVNSYNNLTIAQFHHDTSRKVSHDVHPDPQLHTHCVALNMVQVENEVGEKKWLSLHNDGVFNNSKLMGMVYQNHLAKEVKALGYGVELNGDGTFEIAGFTKEQLEAFSKRRQQIVELEARTKKEERAKMLGKRLAKGNQIPAEELKKFWLSQIEELQLTIPKPGYCQGNVYSSKVCEEAIKSSVNHFSERDVSFKATKALGFALENNIGEIKSFDALSEALSFNEQIVAYHENYLGEKSFTTARAILRDDETVQLMRQGKNRFQALANKDEIQEIISAKEVTIEPDGTTIDKRFTRGQEDAFRLVASSKDQVVGWQGVAGAGKSYALRDLKELAEKRGNEVVGLAPDASAAQSLAEGAEMDTSKTLASFLISESSDSENQIWIVDEAGKINAREMNQLLKRAEKENSRVVLVGDTRQLSAVEAGNPFKLLQDKGMTVAHLTEHRRQKTEMLRKAVDLISEGKIADGLKEIRSEVVENTRFSTRVKKIVEEYQSLSRKERSQTLVLAGTNKERKCILEAIRSQLKLEGSLTGSQKLDTLLRKDLTAEQANYSKNYENGDILIPQIDYKNIGLVKGQKYKVVGLYKDTIELQCDSTDPIIVDPRKVGKKSVFVNECQEICIGDRLRWTKNDRKLGRLNGAMLEVINFEKGKIELERIEGGKKLGEKVSISADETHFLDHSLVTTTYSSQGKTASRVLLSGDFTIGKEAMYVAISRAKHAVKIFVDSYDKMVQRAERSNAKKYALELFCEKELEPNPQENKTQDSRLAEIVDYLKSKQFNLASIKLAPYVNENLSTEGRFLNVARKYAEMNDNERLKTIIVAGSKSEVKPLKAQVRKALFEKGSLKNLTEADFLVPKPQNKQGNQSFEVGDIVVPSKASSYRKYRKGVQYKVVAVEKGKFFLESPSGKTLLAKDSEFEGTTFVKDRNSIAEGDLVSGLANNTLGRVTEISQGKVFVAFENGSSESFLMNKPLPLEHSIVQNSFDRKGANKETVLLCCDHKVGSKSLEQAIDRAISNLEIYTDNQLKLEQRLGWYEEKSKAKNFPKAEEITQGLELFHKEISQKIDRSSEMGI